MSVVARKVREQIEKIVIESVTCDGCGAVNRNRSKDDWLNDTYKYDKITVRRARGESYPESGEEVVQTFHVCPACWEKIAALFGPPTVEERDW